MPDSQPNSRLTDKDGAKRAKGGVVVLVFNLDLD